MFGMNSGRTAAAALLALTVTLGLALPVSADAPLPFRGHGDETLAGVTPVGPGQVQLTVTADAEATYLGQFAGTETIVLDQATGTFAGSRVFIAANGDQLFADVEGAFTSPTTAEGTFTFTGGTGRFAGASGQAAFQVVTSDGVHLTLTTDGSIDY
jgi:hypothetical protein